MDKIGLCEWPHGCEQGSFSSAPIPLCVEHGDALKRAAGYDAFVASKHPLVEDSGREVSADSLSPVLFDFQHALTTWALR